MKRIFSLVLFFSLLAGAAFAAPRLTSTFGSIVNGSYLMQGYDDGTILETGISVDPIIYLTATNNPLVTTPAVTLDLSLGEAFIISAGNTTNNVIKVKNIPTTGTGMTPVYLTINNGNTTVQDVLTFDTTVVGSSFRMSGGTTIGTGVTAYKQFQFLLISDGTSLNEITRSTAQ